MILLRIWSRRWGKYNLTIIAKVRDNSRFAFLIFLLAAITGCTGTTPKSPHEVLTNCWNAKVTANGEYAVNATFFSLGEKGLRAASDKCPSVQLDADPDNETLAKIFEFERYIGLMI